jgi:formylglycine-generating enzyme required for sulfatase activity
VKIRAFYMAVFPVTQAQFSLWKPAFEYGFPGQPDHPAETILWHEAAGFAEWLRKKADGIPPGYLPRLPTEAEWEYACRAGTTTEYWSGDGEQALRAVGWYKGNSENRTHRVGELDRPNPWGLHDMHGNVEEWCWDEYLETAYAQRSGGVENPVMPHAAENPPRVLRGGSWHDSAGGCRSACRPGGWPGLRLRDLGFRLALVPGSDGVSGPVQSSPERSPGLEPGERRDDEREAEGAGGADLRKVKLPKSPA